MTGITKASELPRWSVTSVHESLEAEQLGEAFGIDVTDEAFWTASLDVVRGRIADYERLADSHCAGVP